MSDKTETIKVITFPDGSQTIVRGELASSVSILVDGQPAPQEEVTEVTEAEADVFLPKVTANEKDFATMGENTSTMDKNITPPSKNTEVANG